MLNFQCLNLSQSVWILFFLETKLPCLVWQSWGRTSRITQVRQDSCFISLFNFFIFQFGLSPTPSSWVGCLHLDSAAVYIWDLKMSTWKWKMQSTWLFCWTKIQFTKDRHSWMKSWVLNFSGKIWNNHLHFQFVQSPRWDGGKTFQRCKKLEKFILFNLRVATTLCSQLP